MMVSSALRMASLPDTLETKSAGSRLLERFPNIEDAVSNIDVGGLAGWREIENAFPNARFDGLTIYLSAIVERENGQGFVAPADIDLLISRAGEEFEDSCPARVMIDLIHGKAAITDIVPELSFVTTA